MDLYSGNKLQFEGVSISGTYARHLMGACIGKIHSIDWRSTAAVDSGTASIKFQLDGVDLPGATVSITSATTPLYGKIKGSFTGTEVSPKSYITLSNDGGSVGGGYLMATVYIDPDNQRTSKAGDL